MAAVLVVAPQIEEAEGLLTGFAARGVAAHVAALGALTAWRVPQLDMVVAVGGNGKAQFGVQAHWPRRTSEQRKRRAVRVFHRDQPGVP